MLQNIRPDGSSALAHGNSSNVVAGASEDVGLVDSAEAVDGGAVELHALVEHLLKFGRRDRHRLELTEHVGEPQADETDTAFFDGAKDVLLLSAHDGSSWTSPTPPWCRNFGAMPMWRLRGFPQGAGFLTAPPAQKCSFTLRSQLGNRSEIGGWNALPRATSAPPISLVLPGQRILSASESSTQTRSPVAPKRHHPDPEHKEIPHGLPG